MSAAKKGELRKIFEEAMENARRRGITPRDAADERRTWMMFVAGASAVMKILNRAADRGPLELMEALGACGEETAAVRLEVEASKLRKN